MWLHNNSSVHAAHTEDNPGVPDSGDRENCATEHHKSFSTPGHNFQDYEVLHRSAMRK